MAEKVIRPLIHRFLGVTIQDKSFQNNKEEVFDCQICEKTFQTRRGLKGHETKIHKELDLSMKRPCTEENEADLDPTLDDIIEEKRYSKTCSKCKLHMEATRKYVLIQDIKKHNESNCMNMNNKIKDCTDCDYKTMDEKTFKRHKRDKHNELTASTSPPPKKVKVKKDRDNDDEKMEVEENCRNAAGSSEDFEDMEIEDGESEEMIRSKLMDKKIMKKAIEQEKKDQLYLQKIKFIEQEKKMMERNQMELIKLSNKKRKQKAKDVKKRLRRQNSKANTSNEIMNVVPNIKPVPANVSHLVNQGDKVYVVPGDGACCFNSAAAHLFKDEVFGRNLRRKMNYFFAKLFEKKYTFKTPCSKESPFVRKIGGGGSISFTDPKELIDYLEHCEEADLMWSDSEDINVLSDMYQMKIKIITTTGENDTNPTVNWILPDEELKEYAELKNVEIDDLVLLHENDMHFNLIVSKKSDLAMLGSLSYRANIRPMIDIMDEDEDNSTEVIESERDKTPEEYKVLQLKLKKLQDRHDNLESEYKKCENQLKRKTEEVEKLKIEVKDMKQTLEIVGKEKMLYSESVINDGDLRKHNKMQKMSTPEDQGTKCDDNFSSKGDSRMHIKSKHAGDIGNKSTKSSLRSENKRYSKKHIAVNHIENSEYNCDECPYQGTSFSEITEHIKRAHTINTELYCSQCKFQANTNQELRVHKVNKHPLKDKIRCRICGEEFATKSTMMGHRKEKHTHTVAFCKNKMTGSCPFVSTKCWWRHDEKAESDNKEQSFRCFDCSETFNIKRDLMVHKKRKHISNVRYCNDYLDEKCRFNDNFCWFRHERPDEDNLDEEAREEVLYEKSDEPVFQEVLEDLDPPILKTTAI